MPIRPDLKKFYAGQEWAETRSRILARAENRCERCGVPNHKTVLRMFGWWTPASLESTIHAQGRAINGSRIITLPWHHAGKDGPPIEVQACFPRSKTTHWVGIVLTVAHLNHVAGDDRDDNLKALCQWCHLDYDRTHHKESRSHRKDADRPLLLQERGKATRPFP